MNDAILQRMNANATADEFEAEVIAAYGRHLIVRAGDVVGPVNRPNSGKAVRESLEQTRGRTCPTWLQKSEEPPMGKVNTLPRRDEIPFEINELFIVEVASR